MPSALVVDIGASKTHIVCIDEGLTLPRSRVLLPYGGDDISELLLYILRREHRLLNSPFPFYDVMPMTSLFLPQVLHAMNACKESICCFLDVCGCFLFCFI